MRVNSFPSWKKKQESVTAKQLESRSLILPRRLNVQSELANWFGDSFENLEIAFTGNLTTNSAMFVQKGYGYAVVIEGSLPFWDQSKVVSRPAISGAVENMEDCDIIFIGYPKMEYSFQIYTYIQDTFPGIKGFNRRGLYRMKQFYETYANYEKVSPLVTQINWTNNLLILSGTKSIEEKEFYLRLCIHGYYGVYKIRKNRD